MKRFRGGTLAAKNTVVLKQAEGGMRRLRCPKCQQLAVPATRNDGTQIYRCACGAEFSARAL
jgi:hypothetical protein